jgi:hypothetical protein
MTRDPPHLIDLLAPAAQREKTRRPRCDHGHSFRVTGLKPLLTIWVANAVAPSGEEADWHARSAD